MPSRPGLRPRNDIINRPCRVFYYYDCFFFLFIYLFIILFFLSVFLAGGREQWPTETIVRDAINMPPQALHRPAEVVSVTRPALRRSVRGRDLHGAI
jgi:hypothetical protein